jgi:hypothetical protein
MNKRSSKAVDVGGHIGKLYLLNGAGSPCELRIDADGRWFHGGVEIVRHDIMRLFSSGLRRAKGGTYFIRIGKDEAPVIVEDAPFVVLRVEERAAGGLSLLLSDGTVEPLNAETLFIRTGNIPYCLVRGLFQAKFSRQAYYQLAEYIEEVDGSYYLCADGNRVRLKVKPGK